MEPKTSRESWNWQSIRCSLGLATVLCGQPIAWAVRGTLALQTGAIFAAVPVILGMLLMAQPKWILQRRFHSDALLLSMPILLVAVPFAALSLLHPTELGPLGAYAICIAAMAILLGLNESEALDHIPTAVLALGFIGSFAPMLQFLMNARNFLARLAIEGNSNTLAVATIGGLTAMAAIIVSDTIGRSRIWVGLISAFAFTVGLTAVVLSNTRSVMIVLLVCIPLYVFYLSKRLARAGAKPPKRGNIAFIVTAIVLLGFVPLLVASIMDPKALDVFVQVSTNRFLGAANFFSQNGSSGDTSSTERWNLIQSSWRGIDGIGRGMMADSVARGDGYYPHLSYLQAFYDLGFAGGAIFLIVTLIVPAALIVLRLRAGALKSSDAFVVILFVFFQGDNFFHAVPYSWMSLLPVVLVYALFSRLQELTISTDDAAVELTGRRG